MLFSFPRTGRVEIIRSLVVKRWYLEKTSGTKVLILIIRTGLEESQEEGYPAGLVSRKVQTHSSAGSQFDQDWRQLESGALGVRPIFPNEEKKKKKIVRVLLLILGSQIIFENQTTLINTHMLS